MKGHLGLFANYVDYFQESINKRQDTGEMIVAKLVVDNNNYCTLIYYLKNNMQF